MIDSTSTPDIVTLMSIAYKQALAVLETQYPDKSLAWRLEYVNNVVDWVHNSNKQQPAPGTSFRH